MLFPFLLKEICKVGSELKINPFIIRDKDLESRGFGGIYGVGKASVNPPALAVLSHTPQVQISTQNSMLSVRFYI